MERLEQDLKAMIVQQYGSISKFADKIDMPWTTLDSVLKRGVGKSNISTIIKICQELQISSDELAHGNIVRLDEINREFPDDILKIARGAQKLSLDKKVLLLQLINSMSDSSDTESNKVSQEPLAAHERTDIDVTDEMRKHDDDIMDNDEFWNK